VSSSLQDVLESLKMIWAPGAEAMRVQQVLGVRSLSDMSAAVERAGYKICYVDLPEKVSGLATVIEGQPYIVLNRAKSAAHLQFTVSHELGHHVLHLDASPDPRQGLPSKALAEFQAHQFATLWILLLANDKEHQDVLNQNPEWLLVGAASLLMSAGVILIPLIEHLWSSLCKLSRSAADK
jgi:Zn-dependent peptidase ImmA (M78 family)